MYILTRTIKGFKYYLRVEKFAHQGYSWQGLKNNATRFDSERLAEMERKKHKDGYLMEMELIEKCKAVKRESRTLV